MNTLQVVHVPTQIWLVIFSFIDRFLALISIYTKEVNVNRV